MFKKRIRLDFIVIIAWVLISIPTILFFQVRFLTSTFILFAVPAIYLFLRKPKQLKRLAATAVVGMIASFVIDFLAEFNSAWSWAPEGQLVFVNKLFGLIPIDVLIWYFFWILLTIIYYEHFFEHEKTLGVSRHFKKISVFFTAVLIFIIISYYSYPTLIQWRYTYLLIGFFGSIPFFYLIFKKPRLVGKLLKAGVFNIFLFLSFELTALKLDQWRFPGEYIGTIGLFGLVFPFEEFVFWIILGTPVMLSYYELFVDDGK